jgi:hypothetical protein
LSKRNSAATRTKVVATPGASKKSARNKESLVGDPPKEVEAIEFQAPNLESLLSFLSTAGIDGFALQKAHQRAERNFRVAKWSIYV